MTKFWKVMWVVLILIAIYLVVNISLGVYKMSTDENTSTEIEDMNYEHESL